MVLGPSTAAENNTPLSKAIRVRLNPFSCESAKTKQSNFQINSPLRYPFTVTEHFRCQFVLALFNTIMMYCINSSLGKYVPLLH